MVRRAVASLGALLLPLAAAADGGPVARSLAATCAACHGTHGRSPVPDLLPLAGQPAEFITRRMMEFRDPSQAGTVMHHLANGYTDAQIALVAGYFATLSRSPL